MENLHHFTSVENVKSILLKEYGFELTKITKMGSYYNVNYLATCYSTGRRTEKLKVVVKIFDENAESYFGTEYKYADLTLKVLRGSALNVSLINDISIYIRVRYIATIKEEGNSSYLDPFTLYT